MGAGHAHALYVHEHSPVHRMAPEAKVAGALAFVIVVALTPAEVGWAFTVHALVLALVVRTARLGAAFVARRALVVLPFVAFALLVPFVASGERTTVLGLSMSAEGLVAARGILAKSLLGVVTSIALAGTTETPAIMRGLTRLRTPAVFTAIATFMLRYLEVFAAELGRMRIAMAARGHDPRWLWQAKPVAQAAGSLFVRSYERGERVHAAMLSRGFTGAMPVLDDRRATAREWATAAAPAVVAAVALSALVLVRP